MDWEQREFREQLLIDAAVDDTALAFAIGGIAMRLIPELGPDERRSWILAELRKLLGQGLLQAGYPSRAGFQPWPLAPDRCIERIDREWQALARDPKPGEVVWVTTTDKGHEAAKELVLQEAYYRLAAVLDLLKVGNPPSDPAEREPLYAARDVLGQINRRSLPDWR